MRKRKQENPGRVDDGGVPKRVTRSTTKLVASKPCASKPPAVEASVPLAASKMVNMNPQVVLVDALKIKAKKEKKEVVVKKNVEEPATPNPDAGVAPNRLPEYPQNPYYLAILKTLPPELLETALDFKPVGGARRLQTVVEMAYIDIDEDDEVELSLDDLEKGVGYSKYSDTIKLKANERVHAKDPNESFKLDKEIADVKLQDLKVYKMEIDVAEEDTTGIIIMNDSGEHEQITDYVNANVDDPIPRGGTEDWEVILDECAASDEVNECETTLEIPAPVETPKMENTGELHVIPIAVEEPHDVGPLNLVPKTSKLMRPRSFNPFSNSKKLKQWEKPHLTEIIPEKAEGIEFPLKSSTKFNYKNRVSKVFNSSWTKRNPGSQTEDL